VVRDENGQMDVTDIKINSRVPSKELTERLGIDDIISVLQQNRLRQYMHLLQKQDNDWVKLQDRVPSKELRGRLELEDIISVL